jgi:hypothetical protein
MFTRLDHLVDRLAIGRHVLYAFLAFAGVTTVMTIAVTAFYDAYGAGIFNLAGGRNSADLRTGGYTPDTAYTWLSMYGSTGRRNHLLILMLDLPLILSSVTFAALGLRFAARRLGLPGWARTAFLVLAPVGGLLNLLEDAGVGTLLLSYPAHLDGLAATTNVLNTLKSAGYMLALLTTLIALAASAVAARLSGRRPRGDISAP